MANNTPPNALTGGEGDNYNNSDSQKETLTKPKTGTGNPNNFCQPDHTENDALNSQNQNDQEEKNPSNSFLTYNNAPTIEPNEEETPKFNSNPNRADPPPQVTSGSGPPLAALSFGLTQNLHEVLTTQLPGIPPPDMASAVGSNTLEGVGAHFEQGDERPENLESGLYEEGVADDTQESRQNSGSGEDGAGELDDTPDVRGSRGHRNHRLEGEAALLSTDRVLMEPLALILLNRHFREEDERQAEIASAVDRNNGESAANRSSSGESEEGNQDGHGEGDGDEDEDGDYQEDTGHTKSDDTKEAENTGDGDDSGDEDDNGDDDGVGNGDDAGGEDDTIDNTNVNSGDSSGTQPPPEDYLLPELESAALASQNIIASISDSSPSHLPASTSPEDAVPPSAENASADHPASSSTDDRSSFTPPSGFAGAHNPSQSSANAPGPPSSGNTSAGPSGSSSTMSESQPAQYQPTSPFAPCLATPTEDPLWVPNPNDFGINRRRCPMCVCRARSYIGACAGGPPCDACARIGYTAEQCQSGEDGEYGGGRHERPGRKGRK
ncbi:uncharacterized protein K444DRAFT_636754 [Hyaloscypha bicolor E]|uniref:Uncharacterized protein n=1 Tax=Hyaloscypha bicolor E TaxID=1095630 RepID=A0A2J6SL16_9HELO|nr:uncharacterized protein K444DRAFT_636754 [Hyaloscypha bicolor E]PMD51462.1 hypothetical protein K444DRAFT_636754 [Hyaloscypha bicolor E]